MKYIIIILCFFSTSLLAQEHSLYLKNGQTISSSDMRYRHPLFGKRRIIAENKTYLMQEIDSFSLHQVKFLSKQMRGRGRFISVRPIMRGKINLYDHVRPPRNAALARIIPSNQIAGTPLLETNEIPIDWYHHTDLVKMIKHDAKAMEAFKESRKIQNISTVGLIASVGFVLSPAILKNPKQQTIDALFTTGLALSLFTDIYWIASANRYHAGVIDAITVMNRQ
ncbi:MAG: hypothetical protein K2Y12_07840 [Chitinophagaceae bacterium]|nr:hypothetical protein [Chitinophagaceae bacterium]